MVSEKKSRIQTPRGKVIWTVVATILTLVKLPFWLLCFLPSWLRPHPRRTYSQAILQPLLKTFLYHSSLMKIQTPVSLEPEVQKERFVTIDPPEKGIIRGILTDTNLQPTVIPGSWVPTPYRPKSGAKDRPIVLYLHGGAFVLRSAISEFPAKTLATNLKTSVLSISYRLSCNPNCEFPAALQDAVSAYHYLLSLAIPANQIIIAGDSAGANLVIGLLRYIAENPDKLPHPRAAILSSPWVDLVSAINPENLNKHCKASTDYLPGNFTAWGAREYVPSQMDAASPYISPLNHPFHTETPIWICVGGLEIFCDAGIRFAENMKAKGNRVMVHVEPFASHSIVGVGNLTGFQREAGNAVKLAGEWIRDCEG